MAEVSIDLDCTVFLTANDISPVAGDGVTVSEAGLAGSTWLSQIQPSRWEAGPMVGVNIYGGPGQITLPPTIFCIEGYMVQTHATAVAVPMTGTGPDQWCFIRLKKDVNGKVSGAEMVVENALTQGQAWNQIVKNPECMPLVRFSASSGVITNAWIFEAQTQSALPTVTVSFLRDDTFSSNQLIDFWKIDRDWDFLGHFDYLMQSPSDPLYLKNGVYLLDVTVEEDVPGASYVSNIPSGVNFDDFTVPAGTGNPQRINQIAYFQPPSAGSPPSSYSGHPRIVVPGGAGYGWVTVKITIVKLA